MDDITLDAAERERVLRGTALAIKEDYLDRKLAEEMAAALLQDEQRREREAELDAGAFASSLTKQLRTIIHDKHVDVLCIPLDFRRARLHSPTLETLLIPEQTIAESPKRWCSMEMLDTLKSMHSPALRNAAHKLRR